MSPEDLEWIASVLDLDEVSRGDGACLVLMLKHGRSWQPAQPFQSIFRDTPYRGVSVTRQRIALCVETLVTEGIYEVGLLPSLFGPDQELTNIEWAVWIDRAIQGGVQ